MSWGLTVKIWVVNDVLCIVVSLQVFVTYCKSLALIFSVFCSIIVKFGTEDIHRNYWMVCEFCENRCSESHSLVKGINWYLCTFYLCLVWGKFRILFIMSITCVPLVIIIRPTWNNVRFRRRIKHNTQVVYDLAWSTQYKQVPSLYCSAAYCALRDCHNSLFCSAEGLCAAILNIRQSYSKVKLRKNVFVIRYIQR
jgi:hypothetical protein